MKTEREIDEAVMAMNAAQDAHAKLLKWDAANEEPRGRMPPGKVIPMYISRRALVLHVLSRVFYAAAIIGALAFALCGCALEEEPEPTLEVSSPAPAVANYTTKWRAAWYLGASFCHTRETLEDRNTCWHDMINGFCPDGATGSCSAPVADRRLLDWCLATVAANHIRPECSDLFTR